MPSIGVQRSKAEFQVNTPITVSGGGKVDNYTSLFTTYGQLRKKHGGRRVEAGEQIISYTHDFECRWNPLLETIDKHTRIIINGKTFTIDSWYKVDEKNFYYRFELNEAG